MVLLRMSSDMTFQDFLIESGLEQCEWCGAIEPDVATVRMEAGELVLVCVACREAMEA